MDKTLFQVCQKIVIFRNNDSEILLARRHGEADLKGIFSFVGGKIETADGSIIAGLKREKDEELGVDFKIAIHPALNELFYYSKKDGNQMVLPHYYAEYRSGEIELNLGEYSEYRWVKLTELNNFEPKIQTINKVVADLLKIRPIMEKNEFVVI